MSKPLSFNDAAQLLDQMRRQTNYDFVVIDRILDAVKHDTKQKLAPILPFVVNRWPEEHALALAEKILALRPEWVNAYSTTATTEAKKSQNYTALHAAVHKSSMPLIELLVGKGADTTATTMTENNQIVSVLILAALEFSGSDSDARKMIALLDSAGQLDDEEKVLALSVAVEQNNLAMVRALVDIGSDFSVEIEDSYAGEHPSVLSMASFYHEDDHNSKEMVLAMLNSPFIADLDDPDVVNKGWGAMNRAGDFGAPLHGAAFNNNLNVMEVLVNAGAMVNPPDDLVTPPTPLMSAAAGISPEAVAYLISVGADATLVDKRQKNALHVLAEADEQGEECEEIAAMKKIATLLIKAGCDAGARDADGKTPSDLARVYERNELAKFLDEKAAQQMKKVLQKETKASLKGAPVKRPLKM